MGWLAHSFARALAGSAVLACVPGLALLAQEAPRDPAADRVSSIEIGELAPAQIENLVTLGKVWGFLKYHHPRVTVGELDWDAELFRVMPAVLAAPDRDQGNHALLEWVTRIGEPAPCSPCAEARSDAQTQPEIDWIRDEARLGGALSGYLARVHRNRPTAVEQHYVSFVPNIGNPVFDREKAYKELEAPDAGFRLLALFRFWNVAEYWSPYRELIGENWDAVLAEFVPRLVAAREGVEYRHQMITAIARLNDGHANLYGWRDARPPTGMGLVPVIVRFVEGRPIVVGDLPTKSSAAQNELRTGDVLRALDGQAVEALVQAWSPFYAASNETARLRDIGYDFLRGAPGPVAVEVERGGERLQLTAARLPESEVDMAAAWKHDLPGETFRLLTPEVAYLKLSSVHAKEVEAYVRSAEGTRGWVIDIRNYPSEFVVFALGQHLVKEPTPFVRFTQGSAANPGAFAWTEPLMIQPKEPHYEGRIVILVDEASQSQAEYTAMALRAAPSARVVGSTTAGADGDASRLALPGARTAISGIGVFYPDKKPTQRVGIVPDVVVRPTIAGVREGRDEVLEEALRQILGSEKPDAEIRAIATAAVGGR